MYREMDMRFWPEQAEMYSAAWRETLTCSTMASKRDRSRRHNRQRREAGIGAPPL
jgi:hypothetical protein